MGAASDKPNKNPLARQVTGPATVATSTTRVSDGGWDVLLEDEPPEDALVAGALLDEDEALLEETVLEEAVVEEPVVEETVLDDVAADTPLEEDALAAVADDPVLIDDDTVVAEEDCWAEDGGRLVVALELLTPALLVVVPLEELLALAVLLSGGLPQPTEQARNNPPRPRPMRMAATLARGVRLVPQRR